jgi:hypothetical protein
MVSRLSVVQHVLKEAAYLQKAWLDGVGDAHMPSNIPSNIPLNIPSSDSEEPFVCGQAPAPACRALPADAGAQMFMCSIRRYHSHLHMAITNMLP